MILQPVTTYTTEWIERGVKHGITLAPPDPFDKLPPGSYYVVCPVNYLGFDCDLGIDMKKVMWVFKKVDLGPGEVKKVYLSNEPEAED